MDRNNQTTKTIFVDRRGGFIFSEFIFCAAILSVFTVKLFFLPWAIGIVTFFLYLILFDFLFFKFILWRWFFSSIMSVGWAYFAFYISNRFTDSVNTWIITICAFAFMLWAHWDEHKFESTATISIFDYIGSRN